MSHHDVLLCDAETIDTLDGRSYLRTGNFYTEGVPERVEGDAHSGNWALRLDADHAFGFTWKCDTLNADQWLDITVWRKGVGSGLVLAAATYPAYFRSSYTVVAREGEWEQLRLQATLPPHLEGEEVKVYTWFGGGDPVLFDDLKITFRPNCERPKPEAEAIQLTFDEVAMKTLSDKRKQAFQAGILRDKKEAEVQAQVRWDDGESTTSQVRLKGDWLDHLQDDKWSYRITKPNGEAWSLQHPGARDYLSEWVFQQALTQEDVLTTGYRFVPVERNGVNMGWYACEEHFTEAFLQRRERSPGPVLKFDETMLWDVKLARLGDDPAFQNYLPLLEASPIVAFDEKRWQKDDPTALEKARALLNAVVADSILASEAIDVARTARYYALCDLFEGWHGLTWHNQRWYYNPETGRLEPVVFDSYSDQGPLNAIGRFFSAYRDDFNHQTYFRREVLYFHFFRDPAFCQAYFEAVETYLSDEWQSAFMNKVNPAVEQWQTAMSPEFPGLTYHWDRLQEQSVTVRYFIDEQFPDGPPESLDFTYDRWEKIGDTCVLFKTPNDLVLQAKAEAHSIRLFLFDCGPVSLVGWGDEPDAPQYTLPQPILLERPKDAQHIRIDGRASHHLPIEGTIPEYLFFRRQNEVKIRSCRVAFP